MFKYSIMAFLVGFTGNKLFNKKDKSLNVSVKLGVISGIVLIAVYLLIIYV